MCRMETTWRNEKEQCEALYEGLDRLHEMELDGLVRIDNYRLTIHPLGRVFLRNICMAMDARLWSKQPQAQLFSSAI